MIQNPTGMDATSYTVTKADLGTVVLSNTNTYTGATTITQGTLKVGAVGAIPSGTGKGDVVFNAAANSAILDINGFDITINGLSQASASTTNKVVNNEVATAKILTVGSNDATSTFAGIIADNTGTGGTLALTKTGSGTLTLAGTNTYTGATTVSGGMLAIGSTGTINTTSGVSIGAGEFNYDSATALSQGVSFSSTGGTLSGTGTITPSVTVTAGNTLAPGSSIGTLSFGSGLAVAGTYAAQLGTAGATPVAGVSDLAAVTGNLDLTGGILSLSDNAEANGQGSAGAGTYRLSTFTGTRTGTFASVASPLIATLHDAVTYNGASNGTVDLTLYRLGTANTIATPVSVGNLRVGGTFGTTALSIQNTAAADTFSEGLDASGGAVTGDASTSGSFTNLAAGATNSTSVLVGLAGASTAMAGLKTGTVAVNLASNGSGTSGYGATSLTAQTVTVNGGVYDFAQATYTNTLAFGNVRVGAGAAQTRSVTNTTVTSASFQDSLDVVADNGGNTLLTVGNPGNILAGASGNITYTPNAAGLLTATSSLGLTSNANTVAGLSNSALAAGSIGITGAAYDLANANYTGMTLAFGIVHAGASVSSQTVAFGNQTVTNASFQDTLDVSATTGNAKVTATGFTGLAASAGGATTNNLSFAVNTGTAGSLASTASLTLTSNANGVSGLSNGTATVVGSPVAITTTGGVYSGNMKWSGSSGGNWNTGSNWTDSAAGGAQAAPGLDAGFTNVDSATFGDTAGSVTVNLSGAAPLLNAMTFDGTGDYTVAGATAVTLQGASPSITVGGGTQEISAPVALGSNLAVAVTAGTLNVTGAVSGGFDIAKSGGGTLNFGVTPGSLAGVGNLTASAGTTNVNSVLGGGTSAVSVTGATTLKFGSVSQTLSSLTIGAGSTVTFTSGLASFSGGGGKGASFADSAAVPEPGTLGLLLIGALGVLHRRRRQA